MNISVAVLFACIYAASAAGKFDVKGPTPVFTKVKCETIFGFDAGNALPCYQLNFEKVTLNAYPSMQLFGKYFFKDTRDVLMEVIANEDAEGGYVKITTKSMQVVVAYKFNQDGKSEHIDPEVFAIKQQQQIAALHTTQHYTSTTTTTITTTTTTKTTTTTTTLTTTTKPVVTTTEDPTCFNVISDLDCMRHKNQGFCSSYPALMGRKCAKTCNLCVASNVCEDEDRSRTDLCNRRQAYCDGKWGDVYAVYLTRYCRKTCGYCQ